MLIKILAYAVIPAYTLLFTKGYNWFTTNFSVIGNIDKKLAFFVWGILIGIYFYMVFRKIRSLIRLGPVCSKLIPGSLILLFCAVTTPYLPEELPFKSFLHIVFAFLSTVLLLLFLLLVSWSQFVSDPAMYRSYLAGWTAIVSVSAVLLIVAGIVSSALEIFITLSTVTMSDRLADKIRKRNGIPSWVRAELRCHCCPRAVICGNPACPISSRCF